MVSRIADTPGCQLVGVLHASERATVYRARWDDRDGAPIAVKVRKAPSQRRDHKEQRITWRDPATAPPLIHFNRFDTRGCYVTVMELLRGHGIVDELRSRTAIDVARVHHVVEQLVATLAMSRHPALRTEQIFMRDHDHPILLGYDAPFPSKESVSQLDPYSAPEQLTDPRPTTATNVYAVGVILYELLAGVRPFDSAEHALAGRGEPPSIHPLRPGLPSSIDMILAACLNVDPALRPPLEAIRNLVGFATLRVQRPFEPATIPERKRGYLPTDTNETALVDALRSNPADRATRQVYADWLEQNGFDLRAQHIRFEDELGARALHPTSEPSTSADDAPWRSIVSRAPINTCNSVSFQHACPLRWDALKPTGFDDVRFCETCSKPVFFVTSTTAAFAHGARAECIAIDNALVHGDALAQYARGTVRDPSRYMTMGIVAPPPPPPPPPKRKVLDRLFGWIRKD